MSKEISGLTIPVSTNYSLAKPEAFVSVFGDGCKLRVVRAQSRQQKQGGPRRKERQNPWLDHAGKKVGYSSEGKETRSGLHASAKTQLLRMARVCGGNGRLCWDLSAT